MAYGADIEAIGFGERRLHAGLNFGCEARQDGERGGNACGDSDS
jgi:hypothetical protein